MKRFAAACLASLFAMLSCVPSPKPPPQALAAAATVGFPWTVVQRTPIAMPTSANVYYISPTGNDANTGTIASPKSFQFMRNCGNCADTTIWVRGGEYNILFDGNNSTSLYGSGDAGKPLIVRQYPGELASFRTDAAQWYSGLYVKGDYVWYWGFENWPKNTADRITTTSGSSPGPDMSHYGVAFVISETMGTLRGIKLINLIIHDNLQGISAQQGTAPDLEIYGCLIFYNGWHSTADRGHGHGIYMQSPQTGGTQKAIDVIMLHQFSHGFHVYGSQGTYGNDITLEADAAGNSDLPEVGWGGRQFIWAGGEVSKRSKVQNSLFFVPSGNGDQGHVGWSPWPSNSLTEMVLSNNVFAIGVWLQQVRVAAPPGITITDNIFRDLPQVPWSGYAQSDFPSNDWATGTAKGFIRPNAYEPGTGTVSVYNPAGLTTIPLPLGSIVALGAQYEIRFALNPLMQSNPNAPVVKSGTYTGVDVDLPMTGHTALKPAGNISTPASYLPQFGVFMVRQVGGVSSTPTPSPTPQPPPPSATASATAVPPTSTPSPTLTATQVPPSPSSTATAVPPTVTPTPIPPSVTATAPPPTASRTPSSTASPVPTLTKTSTKSPTPSRTPTKTPTGSLTKRVCDLEKQAGIGPCALMPTP